MAHLDVWEEGFQDVGAGIAGVEEHELGLLQMIGSETLLDVSTLRQLEASAVTHFTNQFTKR